MTRNFALTLTLLALAVPATTEAHEFWVEPVEFRLAAGESAAFRLYVGDGFPGEVYPRNPSHLRRFEIVQGDSRKDVPGRIGDDPAGRIRGLAPGLHWVAYQSERNFIELDAETFNAYLLEEGLESILEQRRQSETDRLPGRELYSRCAKSMIRVADNAGEGYDQALGLELELIPLTDPLELRAGQSLELEARLDGKPLPGLLLRSFRRGAKEALSEARTDGRGRARFSVDAAGVWMVSGVHMMAHQGQKADWRSLWSSLTFAVSPSAKL